MKYVLSQIQKRSHPSKRWLIVHHGYTVFVSFACEVHDVTGNDTTYILYVHTVIALYYITVYYIYTLHITLFKMNQAVHVRIIFTNPFWKNKYVFNLNTSSENLLCLYKCLLPTRTGALFSLSTECPRVICFLMVYGSASHCIAGEGVPCWGAGGSRGWRMATRYRPHSVWLAFSREMTFDLPRDGDRSMVVYAGLGGETGLLLFMSKPLTVGLQREGEGPLSHIYNSHTHLSD